MRFYLDEHFSKVIAEICQRHGIDVLTTRDAGRNGATDDIQLLFAGEEGRCVVTENRRDFERLTHRFRARGLPHAGVLLLPRSLPKHDFAGIAGALIHFHSLYPEGMPPYTVAFLRRVQSEDQ